MNVTPKSLPEFFTIFVGHFWIEGVGISIQALNTKIMFGDQLSSPRNPTIRSVKIAMRDSQINVELKKIQKTHTTAKHEA